MKWWDYLKDKKYLILLYGIVMLFIGTIIYLQEAVPLSDSNGLYVVEVAFTLFILYLIIDYMIIKKHYDLLIKASQTGNFDWINSIPGPQNSEQSIYQELLYKLYQDANVKLDEYSTKNSEDMDFITMWVHEIKTPIAATKLIIENGLDNPTEKVLYHIEDEIDRIEDFIQMSLFYSRANDFAKDYVPSSINMETIVKECIKREYSCITGKKLVLEMKNLDININSDEKWLAFIIKQLIDNAVKYSLPEKTIKIYVEQMEKEVILNIEDQGTGIKKEDIRRIFDKNFTGMNGRRVYNSTGIGLYLSQKLAGKLGHTITVTSKYGCGACFSIHFTIGIDYHDV
ncbi:sensor histidine kinase [Anaerocolumna jejuensis]|uniref:sensor histidine kinase n=1 Tax=Anaerocolumna jejuensis TaxID=259063 RepID=UPI003F7BD451